MKMQQMMHLASGFAAILVSVALFLPWVHIEVREDEREGSTQNLIAEALQAVAGELERVVVEVHQDGRTLSGNPTWLADLPLTLKGFEIPAWMQRESVSAIVALLEFMGISPIHLRRKSVAVYAVPLIAWFCAGVLSFGERDRRFIVVGMLPAVALLGYGLWFVTRWENNFSPASISLGIGVVVTLFGYGILTGVGLLRFLRASG